MSRLEDVTSVRGRPVLDRMNDIKTVILAGGSGVFGRHVRAALDRAGYKVKTLGRGPANDIAADLLIETS